MNLFYLDFNSKTPFVPKVGIDFSYEQIFKTKNFRSIFR